MVRRRAWLSLGVAAVLALAAGCGGGSEASTCGGGEGKPTTVTVGTLPISNAAPLYLGAKKGFFREEGIEVKPEVAQSGNELITGALSGSYGFIFAGYIPSIVARSKGLPITIVSASDIGAKTASKEWTVLLVKPESKIRGPDDLVGRTIAVNGLRGVGEEFISKNPEVTERFKRAMDRSVDYAQANPGEVRKLIPTFTKIPPEVADKIRLPVWSSKLDREQLQEAAQYTQRYGIIKEAPDVNEMVYE